MGTAAKTQRGTEPSTNLPHVSWWLQALVTLTDYAPRGTDREAGRPLVQTISPRVSPHTRLCGKKWYLSFLENIENQYIEQTHFHLLPSEGVIWSLEDATDFTWQKNSDRDPLLRKGHQRAGGRSSHQHCNQGGRLASRVLAFCGSTFTSRSRSAGVSGVCGFTCAPTLPGLWVNADSYLWSCLFAKWMIILSSDND